MPDLSAQSGSVSLRQFILYKSSAWNKFNSLQQISVLIFQKHHNNNRQKILKKGVKKNPHKNKMQFKLELNMFEIIYLKYFIKYTK